MAEEDLKPPVAIDATNLDGSSGSAGQVLQTDGTNTSWVTPSSETVKTVSSDYTTSGETTILIDELKTTFDTTNTSQVNSFTPSESGDAEGLAMTDSGNKMLILDAGGIIYEYNLSTAYDISTASYSGNSLDTSGSGASQYGLDISDDGSQLYVVTGDFGAYNIEDWDLSTNYDITSATKTGNSLSLNDSQVRVVEIGDNDTKLFVGGRSNDEIRVYEMTTANDLSTASDTTNTFSVSGLGQGEAGGLAFSDNGKILFMGDFGGSTVFKLKFGTAWDITTLSDTGNSFSVNTGSLRGTQINSDGTKTFVMDFDAEVISYSTGGGVGTVTLSDSDTSSGKIVRVKDITGNAGSNSVTINTQSSQNIDGSSSISLNTNYGVKQLQSDGTNWSIISDG